MKSVILLWAAITVQPLIATVHESLSGLKAGDFIQIALCHKGSFGKKIAALGFFILNPTLHGLYHLSPLRH